MPIRTEVPMPGSVRYAQDVFSATVAPATPPQIEQLNSIAGDLRLRATAVLDNLREMRTAAFGSQPEAVDSDTKPSPAGAVDLLRAHLQDVSDTLVACESVLREVRRII